MSDIHKKMAQVAKEIGPLDKTEHNRQQDFNYRSIEAITDRTRTLLAAAGVSTAPRMLSRESEPVTSRQGAHGYRTVVEMEYTFAAGSDDSSIVVSMPGEAIDYGDKSTSKACQMAFKYALTQAFHIGSDDPDRQSPEAGHHQEMRDGQGYRVEPPDAEMKQWSLDQMKRVLEAVGGNKEAAKAHWDALLRANDLDPKVVPSRQHKEALETEIALLVGELMGLQPAES